MSKATTRKRSAARPQSGRTQKSFVKLHPLRARFLAFVVAVVVVGGVTLLLNNHGTTYPTASAQTQFCAQSGSGFCLNDWNNGGYGSLVKMYNSGATHESFVATKADVCNYDNKVIDGCPFSVSKWNTAYKDARIYVVKYTPNGLCAGNITDGSYAALTSCGNGHGAWFIRLSGGRMLNVYWTQKSGVPSYMCSGGVAGGPVNMSQGYNINQSCAWTSPIN